MASSLENKKPRTVNALQTQPAVNFSWSILDTSPDSQLKTQPESVLRYRGTIHCHSFTESQRACVGLSATLRSEAIVRRLHGPKKNV